MVRARGNRAIGPLTALVLVHIVTYGRYSKQRPPLMARDWTVVMRNLALVAMAIFLARALKDATERMCQMRRRQPAQARVWKADNGR